MFADRLDGSRFFARVRTFDIACPRCSRVAVVRNQSASPRWNPSTSRWQCQSCQLVLVLGIVAYPRKPGTKAQPVDQVPTWKESIDMRNELQGVIVDEPKGNREPVNVVLREGCCCRLVDGRRFVDGECPIHGWPIETLESKSKAEPRWMTRKRQGEAIKKERWTRDNDEDDVEFEEST